ncbi:alternate-type signal peptide domain-containing protein [Gordonia sp. (in: high G+C Gram-positive bacteria)]|uniref:alternate-type signal peptide domain-containing protein n=1 Tax=Gordonia sp. (in: high G+C Gram-positive bacteria) TaxID=84139 RepID=UPI003C78F6BA
MNKATKGALAAAAAAAILAGGAGTMAAWNGSSELGSGTVTAGALNIEQVDGTGTWHWKTADGAAFDPETQKLVPGDTVVYVGTYRITAVGTNLTATLTPSVAGITGDLAASLATAPIAPASNQITASDNGTNKVIGTAITFNADTDGQVGQGKSASLAGATINLTQNPVS